MENTDARRAEAETTQTTHGPGCWREHPACARQRCEDAIAVLGGLLRARQSDEWFDARDHLILMLGRAQR